MARFIRSPKGLWLGIWALTVGCFLDNASEEEGVVLPSVQGHVTRSDSSGWAKLVYAKRYRVINNVWNKGASKGPYSQRVFLEELGDIPGFGWQWSWPAGNDVVAYPEVVYGDKPWDPPSGLESIFPTKVGTKRVTADFDVRLSAQGTYNMAFSLWMVSDPKRPKETITHEVMVWTVNHGGTPAGSKRGELKVGSVAYDVYVNPNQADNSGANQSHWTYVAFVARSPVTKGPLELSRFADYRVDLKIMSREVFLTSVELGNEVTSGKGICEITGYGVTVR